MNIKNPTSLGTRVSSHMRSLVPIAITLVLAVLLLAQFGSRARGITSQEANQPGSYGTSADIPAAIPTEQSPASPGSTPAPTATGEHALEPTLEATTDPKEGKRPAQPPGIVRKKDFGSWSYTAKRDANGVLTADVSFDFNSVDGVRAFTQANKNLANQLASRKGDVEVTVVFRTPLEANDYRGWAKAATMSQVNAVYIKGEGVPPVQIAVFPRSADALPQADYERAVENAAAGAGKPIAVEGIYSVVGKIPAHRLPAVVADRQVLLVDVTANAVQDDLAAAGETGAGQTYVYNPMPVFKVMELLNQ